MKTRLAQIQSGEPERTKARGRRRLQAPRGSVRATVAQGHVRADSEVSKLLARLRHPLNVEVQALRAAVLDVSPKSVGAVKWNAPSYRTADYRATINIRSRDSIQLILHRGAKVKENSTKLKIPDPKGLVRWLASDRCLVMLGKGPESASIFPACRVILRAWVERR